jgi:hypothetical protein
MVRSSNSLPSRERSRGRALDGNLGDNMNECKGLFGRLFGHKFEPRQDIIPPDPQKADKVRCFYSDVPEVIYMLSSKTYVRDVCTRCGEIRNERKNPTTS